MKKYSDYQPHPVDTSTVRLPEELLALTELMASHTHDTWAQGRLSQGWRYGDHRDDVHKLHPDLVPYDELPEEEKEYDRRTALETLKLIHALGYGLVKRL